MVPFNSGETVLCVQGLKAKHLNAFWCSPLKILCSVLISTKLMWKMKSLTVLLKSQLALLFTRKVNTTWYWRGIGVGNCGCGSQGMTENESGGWPDALQNLKSRCFLEWRRIRAWFFGKICWFVENLCRPGWELGALLSPFYGSFQWLFFPWAIQVLIVAVRQKFSLCKQGKEEIFHHLLCLYYVPFKIKRFD